MKKWFLILLIFFSAGLLSELPAQCSLCKKTAQQLGEKPAKGLNAGIIYLAAAPMLIVGFIGYRWYKRNAE